MSLGPVVLVGLPGAGKTTVGRLLADRLGRTWLDTDTEVERRLGTTVERVFADLGEARFRVEEMAALDDALASGDAVVVSAGGGLVAQPGVAGHLARRATLVWLDADDAELARRVAGDRAARPLLGAEPGDALRRLRAHRAPAHAAAHLHVDCSVAAPAEVADRLAALLVGAVRVDTVPAYLAVVEAGCVARVDSFVPAATRRVLVVSDTAVEPVAAAVRSALRSTGRTVVEARLDGGEQLKHWAVAGSLVERCSEAGLDRDDCVVAVGGGTVGDLAGFVAATYLRGIAWVVVPTTLLGMVDSSIGGKTGVNLAAGKNLAGAFWQPRAVLCDTTVLDTLPDRSFRSAFAEVVKSAMVGGGGLPAILDRRLHASLERDPAAIDEVVRACCELKASVVAADERESGRRAILNYGHTVGHAVEALTGFGDGPDHGEAVAFGMRVAGALSHEHAGCPAEDVAWQDDLLDHCGLTGRPGVDAAAVAARLGGDKKARRGVPRWVLVRRRGDPVSGIVLDERAVRDALSRALEAA